MLLEHIQYENFRNHRSSVFEPSEGINLIYGHNGSGKTSILEGIHYCALTKGFVGAADSDCLLFTTDYFLLESTFKDCSGYGVTVKISYTKEKEKLVAVNNSEIKPFSSHIGRVPCITFSPPEMIIVNGAPAERRRFIDNAISQTDRRYLDDLIAYRRVLQQRNALLAQLAEKKFPQEGMLALWTENLSRLAASIVHARLSFIHEFFSHFRELYLQLSLHEEPSLLYRSSLGTLSADSSVDELYRRFTQKYHETESYEMMRAQTMSGPHRDELLFFINGKEIRKYASQGQLRTFLIALKLAQHRFFYEKTAEKPICLLDDIFSELDASRIADIFTILEDCGQTIITSTEKKDQKNITAFSVESLKDNREH
ncbi:DNA replication and repair protein RecF [Chlorobium sp. BLA1]|uniref:DNA replication/repair protein RecF n=1 Tax=Candidatus Chlorobium masyuteum TaxID=2716876 RepID=UPI001423DDBB|nr:DNA replication and repair protein RecF [Candidatus Chlorobium masyuteum]NHQ59616.1 DNA replication and repair protein RecF [Candidatus Chlorobium masyuteum]